MQAVGAALLAVILGLVLRRQEKESALLLSLAVCSMLLVITLQYLEPVLDLIRQIQQYTQIKSEYITILLKTIGIGLTGEIAALICTDAGNTALGKSIQLMSAIVILWLSVPLFQGLLEIVSEVMGQL